MQLTVNGQTKTVGDSISIAELLASLSLDPSRVAVEVNEDVVSRRTFESVELREGDRIEIVTFVGGG